MSKIEYLLKQNKRRREIENCKKQFSKLLNTNVGEKDFLTIEQTDLLVNKFYYSYKNSKNKVCEKYLSLEPTIADIIKKFYSRVYNKEGYLIIKQTEDCGLLKISVEEVLTNFREIIEFDGDSVCILTEDESEGIYVDYYEENNNIDSLWYYELCYWRL